jgi:hypothetical protein
MELDKQTIEIKYGASCILGAYYIKILANEREIKIIHSHIHHEFSKIQEPIKEILN